MDYEEKKEIKKQISQLLADAGLNQGRLKEIVEEEIRHKVDRALEQTINSLNAQSKSGNYVEDLVVDYLNGKRSYIFNSISSVLKEELQKRMISVTFKNVDIVKED